MLKTHYTTKPIPRAIFSFFFELYAAKIESIGTKRVFILGFRIIGLGQNNRNILALEEILTI